MRKNILLLVIYFLVSYVQAQPGFMWAKQFGDVSGDESRGVITDGSGNVYSTGAFNGTVDFDPGPGTFTLTSSGLTDIFISKLDASGNFVWAKVLGGTSFDEGYGITIDASGNVLTTGTFNGTADFDPGVGTFNLISLGGYDIFVSKLDASGNFVWAKSMGASSTDMGFSIMTDASGNVYTSGAFFNTVDFNPGAGTNNLTSVGQDDIFISKLDASGNYVWAKNMGGTGSDEGLALTIDATGNILTTGRFQNTADFDPNAPTFNLTSNGSYDIFVSQLNSSGTFVMAKSMGGSGLDQGLSIALDGSGNIHTTGSYNATVDFDPNAGVFNLTSNGGSDLFVSKLNSSGNFIWTKSMGGSGSEAANSIYIDLNGDVYTTGQFQATVDFDPNAGVFNLVSNGLLDIHISKLDNSGNFLWAGGIGGTSSDIGYSLTKDFSGNFLIAGAFAVTADFDTGIGVYSLTSNGSSDAVVVKFCNSAPVIVANSGPICAGNSFTITQSGANTYTIQGGSAIVSPTANASYTVIGTSTAGCVSASPAISNVTVNALPSVGASTSNTLLCTGQTSTLTASGASTYTWNPGGAGTSIAVSPTVTSTYTVTGTDANGCTNTSMLTQSVSACTGINQISNSGSEINIYPNPFSSKIIIVTSSENIMSSGVETRVQIFNALGSLIYSETLKGAKTEIDLSKESTGIYFIKIGTVIKKIIKE